MRVLRDPLQVDAVTDPVIRSLLVCRFGELVQDTDYDPDEIGCFVLAEKGDRLADIDAKTGCRLLSHPFTAVHYGEPGYVPAHEVLEEHSTCFEVVFVLRDSGYGIVLIVPKDDAHPEVLAYCHRYSSPAG